MERAQIQTSVFYRAYEQIWFQVKESARAHESGKKSDLVLDRVMINVNAQVHQTWDQIEGQLTGSDRRHT